MGKHNDFEFQTHDVLKEIRRRGDSNVHCLPRLSLIRNHSTNEYSLFYLVWVGWERPFVERVSLISGQCVLLPGDPVSFVIFLTFYIIGVIGVCRREGSVRIVGIFFFCEKLTFVLSSLFVHNNSRHTLMCWLLLTFCSKK